MNARQKAKKLKRENAVLQDLLECRHVKDAIERADVRMREKRVCEYIVRESIDVRQDVYDQKKFHDILYRQVANSLVKMILEDPNKHVSWTFGKTPSYTPFCDQLVATGRLSILEA